MEKTYLLLADGTRYQGKAFGKRGLAYGHLALRAGGIGDVQALTDPVYEGHALVETFPLIGNVGWVPEEAQSKAITPVAYVVKHLCRTPSHYRSQGPLEKVLADHNVVGIEGIDTRALARKVRDQGVVTCAITPDPDTFDMSLLQESLWDLSRVDQPRTERKHLTSSHEAPLSLALIDYGVNHRMVRLLLEAGFDVNLLPPHTPAAEVLALKPDALFLSSGPGDPRRMEDLLPSVRALRDTRLPLMAVGLGHALLALAYGFDVGRTAQGQHGRHRPLRRLQGGDMVYGLRNFPYGVRPEGLAQDVAKVTYDDPMTGTVEGLAYVQTPAWTTQFEPGDQDLYRRFYEKVKENRHALG